MIIQNEPKKIAVTEAQISALRNAYKPQMVQANEVVGTPETNENIINNIVNTSAPEVVNTPGPDALVTDAPKEEQAPVENNTNIFEQNVIVDDPSISNVKTEPEVVAPVQEKPKVEEVSQPVTPVIPAEPTVEAPKAEQPPVAIDNDKFQKLLDDFYDLQLHVQQFGVELEEPLEEVAKDIQDQRDKEEILEIIKKNEIKQDVAKEEVTQTIAQSTPVTPTVEAPKVEQPVVQEPAPQVQSTPVEQNVFNTSFNPNSEFTGNIFDMPPQTNTESGMKL